MTYIDAVDKPCPMPVVLAKKALSHPDVDYLTIKVDNYTAVENLKKMANGLGYRFEYTEISKFEYDVILAKEEPENDVTVAKENSTVYKTLKDASGAGCVIAFGGDSMGRSVDGDESNELGKTLMKSFIYSLTELEVKPEALLFFNSGAFLTSDNSGSLGDLKLLAGSGVRILTCGACINYYKLPAPAAVGEITNMLEIATTMTGADRLINL